MPNTPVRAAAEGMPAAKRDDASINMESLLHDLHNMADVTAELIEDAIGGSHETVTGHRDKFYLHQRQVERLLFCAYQTTTMARRAIDAHCAQRFGKGGAS